MSPKHENGISSSSFRHRINREIPPQNSPKAKTAVTWISATEVQDRIHWSSKLFQIRARDV